MCIFCDIIDGKIPSYTVYEDDYAKAILDVNPMSEGHTIVLAKKHVTSLLEADEATVLGVMKATALVARRIVERTGADGCNILINCREAAGQTIDHMHYHVIPRHSGDGIVELHPGGTDADPADVLKLLTGE